MNWKCPVTGDVFSGRDPRLAGRGNPPTIPLEPAQGTCVMSPTLERETVELEVNRRSRLPGGRQYLGAARARLDELEETQPE